MSILMYSCISVWIITVGNRLFAQPESLVTDCYCCARTMWPNRKKLGVQRRLGTRLDTAWAGRLGYSRRKKYSSRFCSTMVVRNEWASKKCRVSQNKLTVLRTISFTFCLICIPFDLNFVKAWSRNDLHCSPRCKGMLSLPVQILITLDYLGLANNV